MEKAAKKCEKDANAQKAKVRKVCRCACDTAPFIPISFVWAVCCVDVTCVCSCCAMQ